MPLSLCVAVSGCTTHSGMQKKRCVPLQNHLHGNRPGGRRSSGTPGLRLWLAEYPATRNSQPLGIPHRTPLTNKQPVKENFFDMHHEKAKLHSRQGHKETCNIMATKRMTNNSSRRVLLPPLTWHKTSEKLFSKKTSPCALTTETRNNN